MRDASLLARGSLVVLLVGCAGANVPPASAPQPAAAAGVETAADTSGTTVPAGYGSLRQEDIAIRLDLRDLEVRLFPMDESIIRTLSPDSYRTLRDLLASQRDRIDRVARLHALREPQVWYVTFHGIAPEARFTPNDLTISSGGREFRPVEIVPLTNGFGSQVVHARQTQAALYLFEEGIALRQPLVVTMGTQRTSRWADILRTIEREWAMIRTRSR